MPIAPISGSSAPVAPIRTNLEPVKGVSMDFKPREKPETVIVQENEDNTLETGVANENLKGVKEVDVKS